MNTDRFDSIRVGDEEEFTHLITEQDVDSFAKLTGDDNPLHMDAEYAATTSFQNRVVHGMLTASFLSTMVGTRLPGRGALWYEQSLKFLAPVRIGESVRVWAKVRHKSEGQRIVVLDTAVFGEDGRRVIEGEGKVRLLRPKNATSQQGGKTMMQADKGAVIVTGGGGGIGAAICAELAACGHPVVVNYASGAARAEAVVESIVQAGGKALAVRADVSEPADVEAMVHTAIETFGPLAGVVNNASPAIETVAFLDTDWDAVQRHMDVQLKGAFNLCRCVLPHLAESDAGGVVVNIASVAVDGAPPLKQTPYVLAKVALAQLTRCLAVEFGPVGVRVNTVSPGMTETGLIADFPDKAKLVNKMQTPLRRLAEPSDIAPTVAFLFGPGGRHITGQTLRVCGGVVME